MSATLLWRTPSFPQQFAWTSFVLLHPQPLLYSQFPLLEGRLNAKIGVLWWWNAQTSWSFLVPSPCQLLPVCLPTGKGKLKQIQMWTGELLPCSYQILTCKSLPTFSLSRRTCTLFLTPTGVCRHQGVAEGCCDFGKPLYNPPLDSQRSHSLLLQAESLLRL